MSWGFLFQVHRGGLTVDGRIYEQDRETTATSANTISNLKKHKPKKNEKEKQTERQLKLLSLQRHTTN